MPGDRSKLVSIGTFASDFEASLARGALEAAGIRALVPGEALGTFSRHRGGVAGNELLVSEEDRARAVEVLEHLNR